jgi:hypothetical protein
VVFVSLTPAPTGQNLSEIALHTAEWSPQRRPNKSEKSERADDLAPPKSDADRKLRTVPPVAATGGFDIELPNAGLPRPTTTHAITLEETQHEVYLYRDNFIQFNEADQVLTIELEHFHWLGVMTLPNESSGSKERKQEPIAITISQQDYFGLGRFIGIVRTVRSDHAFSLEASLLGKATVSPKPKVLLAAMRKINPIIKDAKLWFVDDARVCEKLLVFEDVMKYWNYKIGVVYCQRGQTTEEQMLANKVGSPAFERFLALLGERIALKGWTGYTADLDTKMDASGSESIFTQWHDFSVMFHVSTLLPYDHAEGESQQVARKRYIGNDLVTIIFQDVETPFTPPCIVSNMLHVFVVISPLAVDGRECYKVSVVSKRGVPQFGPPVGESLVFASGPYFREWLLTKLVNAERASLHHPWLSNFIKKTRRGQLEDILKDFVDQHSKPTTKSSSKADGNEPVGPIAATAQTVARLKKRNRSQVQSPQTINRGTSVSSGVAASALNSNSSTPAAAAAAVPTVAGAKFERLDGTIDWICDQCQKRVAVYKVMVATGAQLTLCAPCAESKTDKAAPPPSPTPAAAAATAATAVAAAATSSSSNSNGNVDDAIQQLEASSGGAARRGMVRTNSSTNVRNEARPAGPAPLPPSASAGDVSSAAALATAKAAPPTSPRSRGRASISLDSQELDNILSALKRDKLRTPVRSSSGRSSIADSEGAAASAAAAVTALGDDDVLARSDRPTQRSTTMRNPTEEKPREKPTARSASLRRGSDEGELGDAFQTRLAELDRRIQELSTGAESESEKSGSRSDKKNRKRSTTSAAGGGDGSDAPPPLPPDEMVPNSVKASSRTSTTTTKK